MTRKRLLVTVPGVVAVAGAIALASGHDRSTRSHGARQSSPPSVSTMTKRWYSPRSLWNTPIAIHPRIAANNRSLIAALEHTNGIGPAYNYTAAIWYAQRSAPTVAVRIDFPRCNAATVRVPIPQGAIPDPSSEGHMAVAQYGTGTEFDFYKAQAPNRAPKSSAYYRHRCRTVDEWTAAKVVTTNWQSGTGELRGSVRGSGTPEGAGTILPRDTQTPPGATWDHALAMAYRNTCSHARKWCPAVAPATAEDGTCTDESRCVPEGARFQLDPSLDCSTWPSLHYVWQRQLCRTLQVYGGIIVDTNESGPVLADQWRGSLGGYTWPWTDSGERGLPNDLLPHFRVLAW